MATAFAQAAKAQTATFDFVAFNPFANATVNGQFGWDLSVSPQVSGFFEGAGFIRGSVSGGRQDGGVFSLTDLDVGIFSEPDSSGVNMIPGDTALVLISSTGSLFPNEDLPLDLNVADFDIVSEFALADFQLGLSTGITTVYNMQSIERVQVSEPTTFGIILAGLGVFAWRMRRRRWQS